MIAGLNVRGNHLGYEYKGDPLRVFYLTEDIRPNTKMYTRQLGWPASAPDWIKGATKADLPNAPLEFDDVLSELQDIWFHGFEYDILVMDTFGKWTNVESMNDYTGDLATKMTQIRELIETVGCAGYLTHHANKNPAMQGGDRMSGSTRFQGDLDGWYYLNRSNRGKDYRSLEITGKPFLKLDDDDTKFEIQMMHGKHDYYIRTQNDDQPKETSSDADNILGWMGENEGDHNSAEIIEGSGVTRKKFFSAMKELRSDSLVEMTGKGSAARYRLPVEGWDQYQEA